MTKKKSKCVFFTLLSVMAVSQMAVPPVFMYAYSVLILGFVIWNTSSYMCGCYKPANDGDIENATSVPAQPTAPTNEDLSTKLVEDSSGRPVRLYYLDWIKIVLTAIVIMHHQTCAFTGSGWYFNFAKYGNTFSSVAMPLLSIDQSYFMCMFFFISGYFTPTSFDRKGSYVFMKDKFKRLGIPYVFFALVLNACLFALIYAIAPGATEISAGIYTPSPGPLWFVGWLLVFNFAYSVTDHSTPTVMELPSWGKWFGLAMAANAVNLPCMILMGGSFAYMPITLGSLPYDVMMFYGGCIAKRNKWLMPENPSSLYARMETIRVPVYMAFIAVCCAYIGISVGYGLAGVYGEDVYVKTELVGLSLMFFAPYLVFTLAFPVLLDFFYRNYNFTGTWTKVLSGASYTAYIIHPFFVVSVTGAFINIYNAANDDNKIEFEGDDTTSTSVLNNDQAWLWSGWIVCNIISTVSTFVVAHYIREFVPGAKSIL